MLKIKKLIFFFFISMLVCSLIIHAVVRMQVARQTNVYISEIDRMHTNIEDRFRLFIDAPLAIGITGAEYVGSGELNDQNFQSLTQRLLDVFDELLGLSLLDTKGKITHVSPLRDNPNTVGRTTQNIASLNESLEEQFPYWLSSPFRLYQGPIGFAFYIPIVHSGVFKGWLAPIISVDRFFKKFIRSEFLETYHLVIRDDKTSLNYFSTSELPTKKNRDIHVHNAQIRGRDMTFLSWRKEKNFTDQAHWPFSILISLIMAVITTYAFWLFDQKNSTRTQLDDINGLLKITVRDTTSTLDAIKYQLSLIKQGSGPVAIEKFYHHVDEISTMVQQMTVLQRLSGDEHQKHMTPVPLLPILNEATAFLKGPLFEKHIKLTIHPENFEQVVVRANKWLLSHSILENIGHYIIGMSRPDSEITVSCRKVRDLYVITYSYVGTPYEEGRGLEHGLFIAQKVILIHQGELNFKSDEAGTNTVAIGLPVA